MEFRNCSSLDVPVTRARTKCQSDDQLEAFSRDRLEGVKANGATRFEKPRIATGGKRSGWPVRW
ncbi:hypothetical protein SBA4_4590022 [Candidatus Sulfopaludibacter sp. SbA4]|nr:hypothetical protein SBA4_4590022 [Candidatus Sulfopaludibacter sp. SbA4]